MALATKPDILMIGHVTRDKLVINGREEIGTGGAVYYGSIPLQGIGVRTAVVTRLHPDDGELLGDMKAAGVQVYAVAAEETCLMENVYPTSDQERRICRAIGFAGSYQLQDIPDVPARVILITPLAAGEVDVPLLKALARRGPVALDVQGFLRVREDDPESAAGQALVFRDWAEKEEGLRYVTYLKLDRAEGEVLTGQNDPRKTVRAMAELGPSEVVMTYEGAVLVYAEGQFYEAPIAPRVKNGRTGRGDTCFATYVGRRLSTSAQEATRFVGALTSLKLEQRGPFWGGIPEVEWRMNS
ncbi:MAG: hypothetical protein GY764_08340 [Halieaceae bacterium]|nr:hypothetical protein [Halieaceae bacterium]